MAGKNRKKIFKVYSKKKKTYINIQIVPENGLKEIYESVGMSNGGQGVGE